MISSLVIVLLEGIVYLSMSCPLFSPRPQSLVTCNTIVTKEFISHQSDKFKNTCDKLFLYFLAIRKLLVSLPSDMVQCWGLDKCFLFFFNINDLQHSL